MECTEATRVQVYPFTRQPSGDEIVIGRPETSTFLVLQKDAVEILDDLAAGKTVGEASLLYQERYGEKPDLADFLEIMSSKGLVSPLAEGESSRFEVRSQATVGRGASFVTRLAVCSWVLLVVVGALAVIRDPDLLPRRDVFFFPRHMTLLVAAFLVFQFVTTLAHESAHYLAARAVGVAARIGFGHRLWVVVAETDLSGIWAVPRSQRFLPILAGPMLDAGSAAVLLLALSAAGEPWKTTHPLLFQFLQALILSYFLRILWQCYLFVRTDFYYALVMMLDCKNLMQDTADYLANIGRRLLGRAPRIDQSQIPAREQRMIRWYAVPWLVGRILAFSVLIFIQIPVMVAYFTQVFRNLSGGARTGTDFVDSLVFGGIGTTFFLFGLVIWIRDLVRRRTHEAASLPA